MASVNPQFLAFQNWKEFLCALNSDAIGENAKNGANKAASPPWQTSSRIASTGMVSTQDGSRCDVIVKAPRLSIHIPSVSKIERKPTRTQLVIIAASQSSQDWLIRTRARAGIKNTTQTEKLCAIRLFGGGSND